MPRVQGGDAVAIALRKVKEWDLPEHSGVIRYEGGQARSAHLTPNSPGGKAIVEHLLKRYPAVPAGSSVEKV